MGFYLGRLWLRLCIGWLCLGFCVGQLQLSSPFAGTSQGLSQG